MILLLSKNVSYTFSPKPRSDVSRFLLIKDLLQFDSHKQPPLISEHQLFTFWVVSYGWFDRFISHKYENTNLRLCYKGQFEKTIWSKKQFCNIVSNGCNTVLRLQCFVALKIAIAVSLCIHVTSPLNLGRMLFKWIRYILFKHHLITRSKSYKT